MEEQNQTNTTNEPSVNNDDLFSGFKIAEENATTPEVKTPEEPTQTTPLANEEVAVPKKETEPDNMNLFDGFTISQEENSAKAEVTPKEEEVEQPAVAPQEEVVEVKSVPQPEPVPVASEPVIEPAENTVVPPVNGAEIKPQEETPTEAEPTSPVVPNDSNNNNNQNDNGGKKGVDMFLVVLFALLAIFIFYIPKISDYMKKGPTKKPVETPAPTATPTPTPTASAKPTNKPKAVAYQKLNCSSKTPLSASTTDLPEFYMQTIDNVTTSKSVIYYSTDDKLKKVDKITTIDYSLVDEKNQASFNTQKSRCEKLSKTPVTANGYKYTCKQTNNKFVETESFDLTVDDEGISVEIDGETVTVISGNSKDDSVLSLKTTQEANGLTCSVTK